MELKSKHIERSSGVMAVGILLTLTAESQIHFLKMRKMGSEWDRDRYWHGTQIQHLGVTRVRSVRICQISNIVVPNVSGSKLIVWSVSNPGPGSYQQLHEYWIAILRHIRSRCQAILEACHKLWILHTLSNEKTFFVKKRDNLLYHFKKF